MQKNLFTKYLKCLNSASNYQHGMGLYIIRNVIKYTPLISKYIGGVYLDRINCNMYLRDLLIYSIYQSKIYVQFCAFIDIIMMIYKKKINFVD